MKFDSDIKDERVSKISRELEDLPIRSRSGSGLIGTGSGTGLNLIGAGFTSSVLSRSSSSEDVSTLRRQKLELESKLREEVRLEDRQGGRGQSDQYYKNDFAITQLTARFWCIILVCTCNFAISIWSSPNATYIAASNKYFWTQLAPQIMHQNLAIILWQFCYGKISFLVFVPGMWPNFTTLHKNFKNVFGNFVSV